MGLTTDISKLDFIAPRPKQRLDRRVGQRRRSATSLLAFPDQRGTEAADRRHARDRRATPRLPIELECEERVGDSRYFRITTDLSTFGLATRQGHAHPVGTRLRLVLYLPDDIREPLEMDAVVIGPYDMRGGMRLTFRNPSVESVRRIHKYLASRNRAVSE